MINLGITVDEVSKAISSLESSVSGTTDQIPALFSRKNTLSLSLLLSLLFNMILKRERVPKIWKKASINPIHTKDPRNTAINNRSVSLTLVIFRTQEHIIHNQSRSTI